MIKRLFHTTKPIFAMEAPLSPAVSVLVHRNNLLTRLNEIPCTGPKGRLLKGDVLNWISAQKGTIVGKLSSSQSYFPSLQLDAKNKLSIDQELNLIAYLANHPQPQHERSSKKEITIESFF